MRTYLRFVVMIAALWSCAMPRAAYADADEPATWQGQRFGMPIWITVVPHGHTIPPDVRASAPWWRWGNTSTDSYLAAIGRPDNVRVVLEFHQQANGLPEAQLYLNQMGRLPVAYTIQDGEVRVQTNGGQPNLILRPADGGWLIGDQVNYRLRLLVDGRIPPGGGSYPLETDGVIDWEIRIGGKQPGTPDWQTIVLVNDVRPKWGYSRFYAAQRMPDGPPFKVEPAFMPTFPHFTLGLKRVDANASPAQRAAGFDWFRENPRPLFYNMSDEQFELLPFVGFQNGGMYSDNSVAPPPAVDFESPFAFYSFEPGSRNAQLLVRGGHSPAGDPYANRALAGVMDRASFRYSWKTEDGPLWRYSLDVAGSYPYTQTVQIGDVQFLGVPPHELPSWVVSKTWPLATFVEAVDGYPGSEGIYFYTAQALENRFWLDGLSDNPPPHLDKPFLPENDTVTRGSDQSIPPGFRGEYSATYFQRPTIYFSPIDNRAHLLYAQGGIWNLGHNRVLRMHNLEGGAHINGWTREVVPVQTTPSPPPDGPVPPDTTWSNRAPPRAIEEALYAFDGYLIYSGTQRAELRRARFTPARFTTPPPTDRTTWLAFRERVRPFVGQARNPEDLRSWLDAFPGTALIVSSGKIEHVRAIKGGFRFVVDLQPGFQLQGFEHGQELQPGKYVVTYDGKLRIEPLTPPALSLRLRTLTPTALETSKLLVHLNNAGRQDLVGGKLEIWAASPRSDPRVVATRDVDLLAGEPITVSLEWTPQWEGEWTLTPKIRQPDEQVVAFAPTLVTALPARSASPGALVVASTSTLTFPFILFVLVTFAAIAALVLQRQWSAAPEEQRDDAR
jgi:hypothetical protein